MMRYTRASVPADKLYLASTAVLMSEIIKTLVCFAVVYTLLPLPNRSLKRLTVFLYRELIIHWKETVKLALPAILYLIQASFLICIFQCVVCVCVCANPCYYCRITFNM
jgi:UDP-sugar transporter A1/2/3